MRTSSRCSPPARKKWNVPLWIPIDIRRITAPAEVLSRPAVRIVRCIPAGARRPAPRGRPVEEDQDGVAAPFDDAGAVAVGDVEQLGEEPVERVADLLRSFLARARAARSAR